MQNCYWFPKVVSAIEWCPLFLSAIKRFFYETLTMISSVLKKSVRYREVSAIKHVRYREVPLYLAAYSGYLSQIFINPAYDRELYE